jgi:hypothetical protein
LLLLSLLCFLVPALGTQSLVRAEPTLLQQQLRHGTLLACRALLLVASMLSGLDLCEAMEALDEVSAEVGLSFL